MDEAAKPKISRGGRNLILLGVSTILIAVLATSISLLIYHNSGDVYLDRSRPGFLPDEEELELDEIQEESYSFDKTGKISAEILGEYLENLEAEVKVIDSFENPFNPEALSDERLGIPKS